MTHNSLLSSPAAISFIHSYPRMNVICFSLVFLCYSLISSLRITARPIGSLFPADAVWDAVDSMSSHDGVVHCGHVTAIT